MPDYTVVTLSSNFNPSGNQIVPWGSVRYAEGAAWWSAGQPTRLTVPAGVTKVRLRWGCGLSATNNPGECAVRLYKNGVTTAVGSPPIWHRYSKAYDLTGFTNNDMWGVSNVFEVTAGDYFEMSIEIDNILTSTVMEATSATYFSMEDISDWQGCMVAVNPAITGLSPDLNTAQTVQFSQVISGDVGDFDNTTDAIIIPTGVEYARIRWCLGLSDRIANLFTESFPRINGVLKRGPFDFFSIIRPDEGVGWVDIIGHTLVDRVSAGDEISLSAFVSTTGVSGVREGSWLEVEYLDSAGLVEASPTAVVFNQIATGGTISGGGLVATNTSAGNNQFLFWAATNKVLHHANAPDGVYWEITLTNRVGIGDGYPAGIINARLNPPPHAGNHTDSGYAKNSCAYRTNGTVFHDNVQVVTGLPTAVTGDIIMVFYRPVTGQIWFGKNGAWFNLPTAAPTYTTPAAGGVRVSGNCRDQNDAITLNGGGLAQTGFTYTKPAGALGLDAVPSF